MAINHKNTPSTLEKFSVNYEYDVTWNDAKKAVRLRTHKK